MVCKMLCLFDRPSCSLAQVFGDVHICSHGMVCWCLGVRHCDNVMFFVFLWKFKPSVPPVRVRPLDVTPRYVRKVIGAVHFRTGPGRSKGALEERMNVCTAGPSVCAPSPASHSITSLSHSHHKTKQKRVTATSTPWP